MLLITANMYFNRVGGWEGWQKQVIIPELAKRLISEQGYDDRPLTAYVNHGNWLIQCPDCDGCERVWEEGWFMCLNCFNASVGHKYRKTIFPEERKEIEMILINRPLPNRNWQHRETIEFLKAENKLHSAELLEV